MELTKLTLNKTNNSNKQIQKSTQRGDLKMKKLILTAIAIAGFASIASATTTTLTTSTTLPGISGVNIYKASVDFTTPNGVFTYCNTPQTPTPAPTSLNFGTLLYNSQFSTFGPNPANTLGCGGNPVQFYVLDFGAVGGAGTYDVGVAYTDNAGSVLGSHTNLQFITVTPATATASEIRTNIPNGYLSPSLATGSGSPDHGYITAANIGSGNFLRMVYGLSYFGAPGSGHVEPTGSSPFTASTPNATNPQGGTFTFTFTLH